MSIPSSTPHRPHRLRTAFATSLVTLGALIAIGVSILFLALTRTNNASPATNHGIVLPPQAHTAPTTFTPSGHVRDPITHKLLRVHNPARGDAPNSRQALPRSTVKAKSAHEGISSRAPNDPLTKKRLGVAPN